MNWGLSNKRKWAAEAVSEQCDTYRLGHSVVSPAQRKWQKQRLPVHQQMRLQHSTWDKWEVNNSCCIRKGEDSPANKWLLCLLWLWTWIFYKNTLTNKCHADVLERSWVPCFSTVDPSEAIMLESEKGRAYFYVLNTMLPDSDKGGKAQLRDKDRVEAGHCYSCILGEQSCTLPSRHINAGASFLFWTVVLPTNKIFLAKAFFSSWSSSFLSFLWPTSVCEHHLPTSTSLA